MKTLVERVTPLAHGLLFAVLVAMAAQFVSEHYGAPVMLMAILLGIPFQYLSTDVRTAPGISFASGPLLRIGVALLGARVSFEMVQNIGGPAIVLIIGATLITIVFAVLIARLFGKDRLFGFLAGGAVAICGASAAMAISSILPKNEHQDKHLTFTVISVTVLSTLAMITYPIIAQRFGFNVEETGIFLGATIHDVAQVVGAGFSVSDPVGEISTIVKLFRVTLLAPIVIVAALLLRKKVANDAGAPALVPPFVVVFVVLVIVNSLGWIPQNIEQMLNIVSSACLVTAVAAVGMKTSLVEMGQLGRGSLAMIVLPTLFLAIVILSGLFVLG